MNLFLVGIGLCAIGLGFGRMELKSKILYCCIVCALIVAGVIK